MRARTRHLGFADRQYQGVGLLEVAGAAGLVTATTVVVSVAGA